MISKLSATEPSHRLRTARITGFATWDTTSRRVPELLGSDTALAGFSPWASGGSFLRLFRRRARQRLGSLVEFCHQLGDAAVAHHREEGVALHLH